MTGVPWEQPEPAPAAVVLAAGVSRRLGGNKLFLPLGGEPLLRRCVRRALAAGLDPVLVVHATDGEEVGGALRGLPHAPVPMPASPHPAASLRTALDALPPTVAAAVVLLPDMPFVTAAMLRRLVRRSRSRPARLVVSEYGGIVAPPVLCHRSLWAELARPGGPGRAAELRARHPEETATVRWPPRAGWDLDLPEDYALSLRLERRARGRAPPSPRLRRL